MPTNVSRSGNSFRAVDHQLAKIAKLIDEGNREEADRVKLELYTSTLATMIYGATNNMTKSTMQKLCKLALEAENLPFKESTP